MSVTVFADTKQYLTYKLEDEIFALEIAKVREVLDFTTITKVPKTLDFMRGVINLRGTVVPVIDMRLKFGMSKTEQTGNTCIVIVEIVFYGETMIVGVLADSVEEVVELAPELIETLPRIGTHLAIDFIKGMGKSNGRFLIILDIDKVFSADEILLVQNSVG